MSSSTTVNGQTKVRSTKLNRRKSRTTQPPHPLSIIKQWLVNNQIRMPLTVLSSLAAIHFLVDQPYTSKFFILSHFNPSTQLYNKGPRDWAFVATWVLTFTLLRALFMEYIFYPFFYRYAPTPAPRRATRFAEQAWSVFYYTISFTIGFCLIQNSRYWGDIHEVWAGYPQIESSGFFKAYYLIEAGFWVHQILVLNIEARRKDFWQMFCHHIITCTLIFMSYSFNATHVGNVILCIMDFSDILLSLAKLLKYLEYQRACDTTFFLFLISWPYTRHYIYNRILYSAAFDAPLVFHRDNHMKPWYQHPPPSNGGHWGEGFSWNPEMGYYMTEKVLLVFIVLLATLQAVLCLWFVMIVRLAVRVVRGAHAEDDRSDEEDEGEGEEEKDEDDVASLSVANGVSTTYNGVASNGIHQWKRE